MVKTMIVSAYAGCGKTWLTENNLKFPRWMKQEQLHLTCLDIDSSGYDKKNPLWVKRYVSDIWNAIGEYDFIFVSLRKEVRKELNERDIPFVTVAPDNTDFGTARDRELTKQQWFGRFLLRDNSHIVDFPKWLKSLIDGYDETMSLDNLTAYGAVSFFLLKYNQYLSDIIVDLFQKKEYYDIYDAAKAKAKSLC